MGSRREVLAAVAERYRASGRSEKGRILDELTATMGWHRKHAVRALRAKIQRASDRKPRGQRYGATIRRSRMHSSRFERRPIAFAASV